jgi:hypothetical protein
VIRALRTHGIEVEAMHNHMLFDQPHLYFMHFSTSFATAFRRRNPMLGWIFTAVIAILGFSLVTPAIRSLFHFGPLHWNGLTLTLATAIVVLTLLDLAKTFWREQLRF